MSVSCDRQNYNIVGLEYNQPIVASTVEVVRISSSQETVPLQCWDCLDTDNTDNNALPSWIAAHYYTVYPSLPPTTTTTTNNNNEKRWIRASTCWDVTTFDPSFRLFGKPVDDDNNNNSDESSASQLTCLTWNDNVIQGTKYCPSGTRGTMIEWEPVDDMEYYILSVGTSSFSTEPERGTYQLVLEDFEYMEPLQHCQNDLANYLSSSLSEDDTYHCRCTVQNPSATSVILDCYSLCDQCIQIDPQQQQQQEQDEDEDEDDEEGTTDLDANSTTTTTTAAATTTTTTTTTTTAGEEGNHNVHVLQNQDCVQEYHGQVYTHRGVWRHIQQYNVTTTTTNKGDGVVPVSTATSRNSPGSGGGSGSTDNNKDEGFLLLDNATATITLLYDTDHTYCRVVYGDVEVPLQRCICRVVPCHTDDDTTSSSAAADIDCTNIVDGFSINLCPQQTTTETTTTTPTTTTTTMPTNPTILSLLAPPSQRQGYTTIPGECNVPAKEEEEEKEEKEEEEKEEEEKEEEEKEEEEKEVDSSSSSSSAATSTFLSSSWLLWSWIVVGFLCTIR